MGIPQGLTLAYPELRMGYLRRTLSGISWMILVAVDLCRNQRGTVGREAGAMDGTGVVLTSSVFAVAWSRSVMWVLEPEWGWGPSGRS